jgi:DNA-binding HxlR family transcriptional regulator
MKQHFGCPVKATANTLAGKWKVLLVWHLSFGSRHFGALRDLLPGISEKVLTEQLQQLQADGIVLRSTGKGNPPRADYALSPAGQELIPIMEAMCAWGTRYLGVPPSLPRRALS